MSTYRTRNQQRQQQASSTQHSTHLVNSPMTPPKTFGKGIVIPVITDIILCIAVCVARAVINNNTDLHLPFRIVPLTLLAAFLIAVFIVVTYIIKQYKYLRNTYQMLEQGMTVAAELNARQGEFVEYSVNPSYYNNGIPHNQYQQVPMQQNSVTNTTSSKSNAGCAVIMILIIMVTSVMGLIGYMSLPKRIDLSNCKLISADVTDIQKNVYEGDEETTVEYIFKYKYSYNGKTYEGREVSILPIKSKDSIQIIINPDNPQYSYYIGNYLYLLTIWGILVIAGIIITIASTRKKRQ